MNANDQKSPYGRGFIAACIVLGATLLSAALLLTTPTSSTPTATPGTPTANPGTPTANPGTPTANPGTPDRPAPTPCAPTPTNPPSPGSGSCAPGGPASGDGGKGCGLPVGDQGVPVEAPVVDEWEVNRRVVVPRSSAYGPGKQDRDGFRRCFAHSPTGAVFAAYNVIAAMADQHQALATVGKLMLPGPETDALLKQLRKETADENSNPIQIAGFRVLDATTDRATVLLAMPVETAFMTATFTLVWHAGDWRLIPPPPGSALGAPYAQQRDLSGFVSWSGV
ncbi:hypothetical protein [Kribbella sp. NPDC006257]|uniref:hypothetical protein n=1 Tax=Kribbella sp. NPDC006257 TaxID=3156738 RepID=UPI0033A9ADD6